MSKSGIPSRRESARSSAPSQTNSSVRILVVDDDAGLLQLNATVLRRFGYHTETAADGAAAWEALQTNGYDLLITDHNMPEISGVELLRKVRSARLTLPVILASGALPTAELYRSAWLQPVATLAKPFSIGRLLATVNEALAPPPATAFSERPPGSHPEEQISQNENL